LIEPAVLRWRKGKLGQGNGIELALNSLANWAKAVT
jgi:hypothetical protein